MTILSAKNTPRVTYTATSGQTAFTIPFEFFSTDDIKVYNGTTLLTYNASPSSTSQYSITGTASASDSAYEFGSGGTVTIGGSGATTGDIITIIRDIAIERTSDFSVSGTFDITSLNTDLDKIYAKLADIDQQSDRSVKLLDTDSIAATVTLPAKATRASKVFTFDSDGDVQTSIAATDVTTVAGISSDVTTVSGIASNVTSVAGNSSNINTVAGAVSNINTVAGISSDVTSVAGISSNVTTVAGKASLITSDFATDMSLVTSDFVSDMALVTADFISDVNTLATSDIVTDLNLLATSDFVSDLNQLATSDFVSDLNALEAIKANVNTVAGISSNVTSVADNSSNINSAVSNASNINTVAGGITNINTVATNLSSVNNFSNQYRIGSSDPTDSLDEGDLFYNSTNNVLKYYDGSSWTAITSGGITSVAADTTPQLGGNLDMNGQDIITTSNADLELAPNGTGHVTVKGNSYPGAIQFNCEANTHGQIVKAQPHSASVTNELTLPAGSNQEIVGTIATQTLTNKTLTTPTIASITNGGTVTIPSGADTLVARTSTDTLTNKTISGSDNTLSNIATSALTGTITNSQLAGSISNDKLANSSITLNGSTVALGGSSNIAAGATGAGGDEVFVENERVVTTNYTLSTGKSAMCVGPLTINSGVTVTVPSGERLLIL